MEPGAAERGGGCGVVFRLFDGDVQFFGAVGFVRIFLFGDKAVDEHGDQHAAGEGGQADEVTVKFSVDFRERFLG